MKDSYRDAYGTAIIYAHARELADSTVTVEQLMNDNSPQAIALAEQRLKEMKPNIAGPSRRPMPWVWNWTTPSPAKAATSGTTAG